jgi:hypothetical protein
MNLFILLESYQKCYAIQTIYEYCFKSIIQILDYKIFNDYR